MTENTATRNSRLEQWASNLTDEQAKGLIVELINCGIDGEEISFWDDALAPYWRNSGEPLVEGQKCYADD